MKVRFKGDDEQREGVQHINFRASGDVVLRYSGHKETVKNYDHSGFEVSPE